MTGMRQINSGLHWIQTLILINIRALRNDGGNAGEDTTCKHLRALLCHPAILLTFPGK